MSTILVTGGTGTLGRLVVPRLQQTGARVCVLSRRPRSSVDRVDYVPGDLATGAGVDDALRGVETVVHLAGNAKGDGDLARTLVAAAAQADRPHLVNISVVGAERVPVVSRVDRTMFGYFAAKREAEVVVAESGLPWTTLHATQFHDLTLTTVRALGRLPVIPVSAGFRFQPVEADEVAARLVELALATQPAWCRTWVGRRRTGWTSWCGPTSRRAGDGGRWSRCGCRGRRPQQSGAARTWPSTTRSASGPGRTFSPRRCVLRWRWASPGGWRRPGRCR
jgi:uncharacterized protein YbjT (DUF2867 family)